MVNRAISVIIPIYNSASTLPRCIDSVLAQSWTDRQIVLVDDGSPDSGGRIADDYALRHRDIMVVHQPNRGLAEARRAGVMAATGQWVVHLDSDDTLAPHALETLYGYVAQGDLDIAWGCYNRVTADKPTKVGHHIELQMSGRQLLDHVLDLRCICASWGSISRRDLWLRDIYPPEQLRLPGEDVFIHIKLSQFVGRAALFNDVVYNYYYNPRSLTQQGPLHRQQLWQRYFALVRDNLRSRGLLQQLEQRVRLLEVDRLAFSCRDIDPGDPWLRQVVGYPSTGFPLKHRLLQQLLRHPALLRRAIALKRAVAPVL